MTPRQKTPQHRSRYGGGSIYYDKARDRYCAQILDDGKRRTVGRSADRDEAVAMLNAALAPSASIAWDHDEARPVATRRPASSVADLLAWWRDEILPTRELAPSTEAGYRWAVGEIVEHLGPRDVHALTTVEVQAFLTARIDRLSRNSIRVLRVTLNLALDAAVHFDLVERNVARFSVLPHTARKPRERDALDAAEVRRLMTALDGTLYGHLFAIALHTGARRGELLGLAWSSVDLDAGTILIRQGLRKDETGRWSIGPTKTTGSVRTIRLSPSGVEHLRARRADQRREQIAARVWVNAADLVFTTPTGRHLDPRKVDREWRKVADAAKLPTGAVLHELRHTLGSHLVDAGVPLAMVADVMGHSSLDEVSRVYRHRVAPVVEGAAGVIDALLAAEAAER